MSNHALPSLSLPAGFEHSHESRMFEQLTEVPAADFAPGRWVVYLKWI